MNIELKKEARRRALSRRADLTEEERRLKSRVIELEVLALPEFTQAKIVMSFLNFRNEAETTGLAEQILALGKQLILPRCAPQGILIPAIIEDLNRDVEPGMWGIREPRKEGMREVDPSTIDLIIVPGAAFDLLGNRLGYGGGYYDRFFARLRPLVPRVALGFETQILPEVPIGQHDQKMTILITEEGVRRF